MQLAVQFIIPLLLGVSAMWLAFQEFYNYNSERKMGRADNLKLCRRLFGSLLLIVIAYMIYSGDTSLIFSPAKERLRVAATQEQAVKVINYWSSVLGLVFLSVIIAIWDVVAGLRKIRMLIAENTKHEVAIVKEMITSAQLASKAKTAAGVPSAALSETPAASQPSGEPSTSPDASAAAPSAEPSKEKENIGSEEKIVRRKKGETL
ncbi:MAG: hypothetical protein K6G50_11400 [bacterium]|nr:hypothetical protein [bacterium]